MCPSLGLCIHDMSRVMYHVQGFIMLMILISSITLALDRPTLDPASSMAEAVKIIEWTINILFAIEMIIKLLLKVSS